MVKTTESERKRKVERTIQSTYKQLGAAMKLLANVSGGADVTRHLSSAQDCIGKADLALIRLQAKSNS